MPKKSKEEITKQVLKPCVQCGKNMERSFGNEALKFLVPFCENPACPNYGLLQTGLLDVKE